MNKNELTIAKENATIGRANFWHKAIAKQHLAHCKRELRFLMDNLIEDSDILDFRNEKTKDRFHRRMTDLEQAIGVYDDALGGKDE